MSHQDSDLEQALRSQAESFDGTPLTLADVRSRAGRIQRRRRIAASVAAAAAVAIIAPIGLLFADNQPDSAPPATNQTGTTQSPTVTPTTTENAGEAPVYDIDLSPPAEGLTGAEPGISYWYDGQLIAPNGDTVSVDQPLSEAVREPVNGQWAGITFDEVSGVYSWTSLDESGTVLASSPSLGSNVAVTPDGSSYAYLAKVAPEGSGDPTWQLVKGGDGAQTWDLGAADPASPGTGPVGILADGSVVFEFDAGRPRVATADGSTTAVPGNYLKTVAASGDRIAVQTSYNDDGTSCWAVVDTSGKNLARTCDHALDEFSADGRYLMGTPSEGDGLGASAVWILDAQTLEPAASFRTPRGAFVSVPMAWDGDTLLAQVWNEGAWTLQHLSVDGVLQQRSVSVQADETTAPFQFGAGPLS